MTAWWLVFILGSLFAMFAGFVWVVIELRYSGGGLGKSKDPNQAYSSVADEEVSHLFNNEFREELRNQGRLRFKKIIDDNAMFLKQDLDLTISQLNEHMKQEVSKNLEAEFAEYAQAMNDAQQLALNALKETAEEVEAQRLSLAEALKSEVAEREKALIKVYEDNMAQIIEHYVLFSLGDQFDLKSQLPYILKQMEDNKQNIIEDMRL